MCAPRLQREMSTHHEQGNREGVSQEKILAARIFSCETLSTALLPATNAVLEKNYGGKLSLLSFSSRAAR
jgi:hypothetical protein